MKFLTAFLYSFSLFLFSGLGQPVRYALELAGVEYTDVRVEPGPGMCYMPLLFFFG